MDKLPSMGIDGCTGGWIGATVHVGGDLEFRFMNSPDELREAAAKVSRIFIDMPFGLEEDSLRECDLLARERLGKWAASIFLTPCRAAVYAPTYEEACAINFEKCGKKISIQAWNIVPKIRELDRFLRNSLKLREGIWESHPELCFQALNGGRGLLFSKHRREGVQERFSVLRRYLPEIESKIGSAHGKLKSRRIGVDDFLDAAVLAVCAGFSSERLTMLPEYYVYDSYGLRMNIVVPQITL
ncbi:MAG: DUF429 domain-containing protein [Calditrichaeota bacterium]|nr:DUF429 domain-containing protein [Calditrichota bacterium]